MKKFLIFFFSIFIFFSNVQKLPAQEFTLDLPDFSGTKKHMENIKNKAIEAKDNLKETVQDGAESLKDGANSLKDNIQDNLEKDSSGILNNSKNALKNLKDKSKIKYDQAKENVTSTVLKTGKPTDQNLSNMPRRQRSGLLLKYQDKGYYGTLPNIEREFDYLKQINKKTALDGKYKDTLIDEMNLQKAPLQDDLFLDVILKKQGDTQYTKDVLRFIPILENFRTCINENCNIQKFNANVNVIDLYTRRLEKDHGMSPESSSESFYLIRNIAYLSKLQGNLKYEANFYSKYMPLQGSIYSKENIQKKDIELLLELDKTIFALRQLQ